MFNIFTVQLQERLQSKATPILLEELSGISQRTWRTRLKEGWEPTFEETDILRRTTESALQEKLVRQLGYSEQEALEMTQAAPSHVAEFQLPTADLIYWNSHVQGGHYAESIAVATQFDTYCQALCEAFNDRDLDRLKQVLLQSLGWLKDCSQAGTDLSDAMTWKSDLIAPQISPICLKSQSHWLNSLFFMCFPVGMLSSVRPILTAG